MGEININKLLEIVDQVEGWLFPAEQLALLNLPSLIDHLPGHIVEIGSYKGKSTIALGLGSSIMSTRKRPVYSIDPFVPDNKYYFTSYFEEFWENIKKSGLENFVIPIKKYSTEAYLDCPDPIAALFIDGDHDYSSVKHDIVHYTPRVVKGGFIAFHDYGPWQGVNQAVDELLKNGNFEYVAQHDSLLIIQKK